MRVDFAFYAGEAPNKAVIRLAYSINRQFLSNNNLNESMMCATLTRGESSDKYTQSAAYPFPLVRLTCCLGLSHQVEAACKGLSSVGCTT